MADIVRLPTSTIPLTISVDRVTAKRLTNAANDAHLPPLQFASDLLTELLRDDAKEHGK